MLKLRSPVQNRPCSRSQSQNRRTPKALFIQDVTLPDGISCYPGITVLKTWALKNTGEARWPEGVQLLFLSGALTPERILEVPRAEPGAVVNVSAEIKLPLTPKQYTGYYRLATAEGKKFGTRFWVDLIVVVPSNTEKEAKKELEKEPQKADKAVEKESENLNIKKVESPTADAQIQIIPSPSEPVQFDNQTDKQTVDAKNQPEPPKDQPKKEQPEVPKVDIKQPEVPKVDIKQPEVPKVKQPEVPKVDIRQPDTEPKIGTFASQLEVLANMGWKNGELNSYLLEHNEGDVRRVIDWILSHGEN